MRKGPPGLNSYLQITTEKFKIRCSWEFLYADDLVFMVELVAESGKRDSRVKSKAWNQKDF